MFKWKVSGLGGGSKKSKADTKPEILTKMNNGQVEIGLKPFFSSTLKPRRIKLERLSLMIFRQDK
jgi:hypothetical protein